MAELLGAIDTDYRSPKITDDHIQQSTAVRATEMMNLRSQMMTRGQQADTAAANTASLIQSRISQSNLASRQADLAAYKADVEADRTYNLIDMNLRSSEREDLKMPYVLEGLAAQNWINSTIAERNELTNEYDNATMGARIEGAALDAKNKLASLNGKRAETQRAKAQSDRETADAVVWTEFMNDLDAGVDIDTLNPIFTSKKFNTLLAEKVQIEHEEIDYKAAVAAKMKDQEIRTLKVNGLREAQREAYLNEPDRGVRAQLMQDSIDSNTAIKRLHDISADGAMEASRIRENRDPLLGMVLTGAHKLVDQYGNLTDNGKTALNAAVARSEAKKVASSPTLEAIRLRNQLAQPTAGQRQLAKQKRKEDLVQSIMKSIPDDAGDPPPEGAGSYAAVKPYTPQRKMEVATEMAEALMADSTLQAPETFTSAHEELRAADPAAGIEVDKLKAEVAAINKIVLDWGKKHKQAAFDSTEEQATAGAPAMDSAGFWAEGPDIMRGKVTQDESGRFMSSMGVSKGGWSTWDYGNAGITKIRNEILAKIGSRGEAEMFDITKPHPFALRQWRATPPVITSMMAGGSMQPVNEGDAAWAYNKNEPNHDDRWTRIMLVDSKGKKKTLQHLRRQYSGKLISGIDFSDSPSDYGRPTPNNSTPAAW
jgi:hypothetical protein